MRTDKDRVECFTKQSSHWAGAEPVRRSGSLWDLLTWTVRAVLDCGLEHVVGRVVSPGL